MTVVRATAVLRLLVAALIVAAVLATAVAAAPIDPFNLFGYFTVQGNVIGAVVAVVGAVRLLRGTPATTGWSVVRWCAATYLIVVGVVYWAVLAPLGAAGGVAVPWANTVLHLVAPLAAVVDLLLAPDRSRPALRLLPLVLVYPLVWTAVVLVRGATDGWVPYPFLSPAQGYGVVAAWVVLVAGVFTGVGALARLPLRASRS
ncbi:Pr6Pr family membrane protein [Amnibacterium kyonggiense]